MNDIDQLIESIPAALHIALGKRLIELYPQIPNDKESQRDRQINKAVEIICDYYAVLPADVRSKSRALRVRAARAAVIHILNNKVLFGLSRVEIGRRACNNQSNSAILYHERTYFVRSDRYKVALAAVCALLGVEYDTALAADKDI